MKILLTFPLIFCMVVFVGNAVAVESSDKGSENYNICEGPINENHREIQAPDKNGSLIKIMANEYWNASGLILKENKKYVIDLVSTTQTSKKCVQQGLWCDKTQPADIDGWLNSVPWYLNFISKIIARVPEETLFQLIGVLNGECRNNDSCQKQFPITNSPRKNEQFHVVIGQPFVSPVNGVLCFFANDWSFMYENNSGHIQIKLTPIEDHYLIVE